MERFTISLEKTLAQSFDELIRARGYANRSEAVRDVLRRELERNRLEKAEAPYCVANLSYVYNHHERQLSERLTEHQHRAHDLVVSTMHVHLDHDHCLESMMLRGETLEVRRLADSICAERGVRHGELNLIPADHGPHDHHVHSCPKT